MLNCRRVLTSTIRSNMAAPMHQRVLVHFEKSIESALIQVPFTQVSIMYYEHVTFDLGGEILHRTLCISEKPFCPIVAHRHATTQGNTTMASSSDTYVGVILVQNLCETRRASYALKLTRQVLPTLSHVWWKKESSKCNRIFPSLWCRRPRRNPSPPKECLLLRFLSVQRISTHETKTQRDRLYLLVSF